MLHHFDKKSSFMRLLCIIFAQNGNKTIQNVNKIKKNSNFEVLFKK